MARVSKRKQLIRLCYQLFGLLLVFYLFFLWKVKIGVDDFFNSQPAQLKLEYHWLLADWQGNLYLRGVDVYNDNYQRLASAPWVTIDMGSFSELWSLNTNVIYQNLPHALSIKADNAQSYQHSDFFEMLNFAHLPSPLSAIPEACQAMLTKPDGFTFSLTTQLEYQENDETLDFAIQLTSKEFADITFTGRVDSLSSQNWQNGYLSQALLSASRLTWLQNELNTCKATTQADTDEAFAEIFSNQLESFARLSHYRLDNDFILQYRRFILGPEEIEVSFSPEPGSTWAQLQHLPLAEITDHAKLTLKLNKKRVASLLSSTNLPGLSQSKNSNEDSIIPSQNISYLPVNYRGLRGFVGTRVQLNLKNQTSVKGVIRGVSSNRLLLNEYQFGGHSELPYRFSDIDSIEVNDTH